MNREQKQKNSIEKPTLWELYLTKEIGIEFKACLYFFAILFFYCVFKVAGGIFVAGIWHMAEMIFTCYFIGYLQVYLLRDFDEADTLGAFEWFGMLLCTGLYCLISYIGGWFDRKPLVTAIFACYLMVTFFCVFLIYKTKRRIDDKHLNEELRLFQAEHKQNEK